MIQSYLVNNTIHVFKYIQVSICGTIKWNQNHKTHHDIRFNINFQVKCYDFVNHWNTFLLTLTQSSSFRWFRWWTTNFCSSALRMAQFLFTIVREKSTLTYVRQKVWTIFINGEYFVGPFRGKGRYDFFRGLLEFSWFPFNLQEKMAFAQVGFLELLHILP